MATIQYVVLMPALFLLLFLGVQIALFYYARSVAIGAATEGARTAAAEAATHGDGEAAAWSFLAAAGEDSLRQAAVSATRTATQARVTVTGTSMSVIPGWEPVITQTVAAPVERATG